MNTKTTFLDRILQNRLVSHLLFWGVFFIIFTTVATLNSGMLKNHIINYLSLLPAQIMAAYVMVYYQVPQLLMKKRYIFFALSLAVTVYFFSVMARFCVVYLAEPFIRSDFEQETLWEIIADPFYLMAVYFPLVYVIVFLMLAIKMIKQRFEVKHEIQLLEKDKATNELKFLKGQIHPHFLFNTLNNLYALTLAKSDAAPEVVVKLSEMLDYMLYQCNGARVPVQKEIELIQGYVDLEMLRYGAQLKLKFTHDLDDVSAEVAPLILVSLVENAFKHGASGNPINPEIEMHLSTRNGQLYFKVFNTQTTNPSEASSKEKRTGIGATNVKRQLAISYPNQHRLIIEETKTSYLVNLTIDLN